MSKKVKIESFIIFFSSNLLNGQAYQYTYPGNQDGLVFEYIDSVYSFLQGKYQQLSEVARKESQRDQLETDLADAVKSGNRSLVTNLKERLRPFENLTVEVPWFSGKFYGEIKFIDGSKVTITQNSVPGI